MSFGLGLGSVRVFLLKIERGHDLIEDMKTYLYVLPLLIVMGCQSSQRTPQSTSPRVSSTTGAPHFPIGSQLALDTHLLQDRRHRFIKEQSLSRDTVDGGRVANHKCTFKSINQEKADKGSSYLLSRVIVDPSYNATTGLLRHTQNVRYIFSDSAGREAIEMQCFKCLKDKKGGTCITAYVPTNSGDAIVAVLDSAQVTLNLGDGPRVQPVATRDPNFIPSAGALMPALDSFMPTGGVTQ